MGTSDDADDLYVVLERICSLFRSELREHASQHSLKLVQLEALVYFSIANRYSNTAGALAEYLGVTKGTASQTVMALQRRGLVEKVVDQDDARVFRCALTAEGRDLLEAHPPTAVLHPLGSERMAEARTAARQLLRALQAGRSFKAFGQCHSCAHFRRSGRTRRCGLTGEALSVAESRLICREHTLPVVGPG